MDHENHDRFFLFHHKKIFYWRFIMGKYDMISGLAEVTAKDVVRNEKGW